MSKILFEKAEVRVSRLGLKIILIKFIVSKCLLSGL